MSVLCKVGLHDFPRSHWNGAWPRIMSGDFKPCKRGCGAVNTGLTTNYPVSGVDCPPYSNCELHDPVALGWS